MSKSTDTYTVLSELDFDGRKYMPGDEVELDRDTATPLLVAEVVSDGKPPPAEETPLAGTLDALREATPEEVRAFAAAMGEDPDIAAKLGDIDARARETMIRSATEALALGRDAKSWTDKGPPTVQSLEKVTGLDVSAAERDAAWAERDAA